MSKKKLYEAHVDMKGYQGNDVLLIVCPASHDQSGAKLRATVKWIEESGLSCRLVMADLLDRYNSGTMETARARSDMWLYDHGEMLGSYACNPLRWDAVMADATFNARLEAIIDLYRHNDMAKKAVDDICVEHTKIALARLAESGKTGNYDDMLGRSISYMIEEIAGLAVIRGWTSAPEIYPGLHFSDPALFDRMKAEGKPSLLLPGVLPVTFTKVEKDAGQRRAA